MITMLLLGLLQAQAGTIVAPPSGGWSYAERTDPGAPRMAVARVRDENGALLLVKCDVVVKPIVSVQFIPQPRLAAGAPRRVQLTLDDARAEFDTWNFPGSGAYVDDPANVYIYASEIAAAKKVSIGFDDDGKTVAGEFKGPGDDTLFRKVFAMCERPYAMPDPRAGLRK